MGIEQRRHERFDVRLAVRYRSAAEFVADYVENLSQGGLFIAGASKLEMNSVTDVTIDLPGQGEWTVRAKAVFILDPEAARKMGRAPGAGLEIVDKPAGFDDALLGYLLRLGRRRDHAVMVGDVFGSTQIADSGYRLVPLVAVNAVKEAFGNDDAKLIAVIVPSRKVKAYAKVLGDGVVFAVDRPDQIPDVISMLDSLT